MTSYSQLYVERGRPGADSARARRRLGAYLRGLVGGSFFVQKAAPKDIAQLIEEEQGTKVPINGSYFVLEEVLEKCELRDLLDFVTLVYHYMIYKDLSVRGESGPEPASDAWRDGVRRIFQEENLAYRVDDDGVVHPCPDAEFEINRASALAALDVRRFAEARGDFEDAFRHLRKEEGKQALRMMFPAIETAAKVLFPEKFARLMSNEVDRFIKPVLEQRYAGNQPALHAGRQLLDGFKSWINAAQPYRHGQEQQEPAEPPPDFVIAHLSAGAAYLRWMIELCSE